MLYVADFANGAWNALDFENNPVFRDNGFASQADVLVRAPRPRRSRRRTAISSARPWTAART